MPQRNADELQPRDTHSRLGPQSIRGGAGRVSVTELLDVNDLYDEFVRRIADQLYPVPAPTGSDFEQDRFEHRDIQGWNKGDILADLEALRMRRRLLPHAWLDEREAALQDYLPRPRARNTRMQGPRSCRRVV